MASVLNILMLEASDPDARQLIRTIRSGGLQANYGRARDRSEFLLQLENGCWDILLCDCQQEDLTARQAISLLHQQHSHVPVIVVGDGADAGMAASVMHAGAHDFVSKRDLSRLVPAIERELAEQTERRRAEQVLHETELRLRQLSENIQEVFWLLDAAKGKTLYLSPSFEEVWERPSQQMLSSADFLLSTIYPEDVPVIQQVLDEQGWAALNHDYRIVLPDGAIRWIHTRSFELMDEQDQRLRIAGISTDITEHKHLVQEKDMMSRALEQSADAVMITDVQGVIVYVNGAFEDLSGYSKEEVLGRTPSLLRSGLQNDEFYRNVWQTLNNGLPFCDVFINRRKDGELFYEAKSITPLRGREGVITHYVSNGKDITERLKGRERLQKLLHYDVVSGLASRILLHERLHQAVLHARRLGQRMAVVCLELGLGELLSEDPVHELHELHELHERMIRRAAEVLQAAVEGDITLARLNGDEFVVLLKNVPGDEQLAEAVLTITAAFAPPLHADGYELFVTPATGVSVYPEHSLDADELLLRAELAMHHARQHGLRSVVFYQQDMR